jgi:hypothetical protein
MTNAALSKAMGIPPPSRGGRGSRPSTSQLGERPPHLRNLDDQQILDLLFRILHTDSVPACRAWLNNATENGGYSFLRAHTHLQTFTHL